MSKLKYVMTQGDLEKSQNVEIKSCREGKYASDQLKWHLSPVNDQLNTLLKDFNRGLKIGGVRGKDYGSEEAMDEALGKASLANAAAAKAFYSQQQQGFPLAVLGAPLMTVSAVLGFDDGKRDANIFSAGGEDYFEIEISNPDLISANFSGEVLCGKACAKFKITEQGYQLVELACSNTVLKELVMLETPFSLTQENLDRARIEEVHNRLREDDEGKKIIPAVKEYFGGEKADSMKGLGAKNFDKDFLQGVQDIEKSLWNQLKDEKGFDSAEKMGQACHLLQLLGYTEDKILKEMHEKNRAMIVSNYLAFKEITQFHGKYFSAEMAGKSKLEKNSFSGLSGDEALILQCFNSPKKEGQEIAVELCKRSIAKGGVLGYCKGTPNVKLVGLEVFRQALTGMFSDPKVSEVDKQIARQKLIEAFLNPLDAAPLKEVLTQDDALTKHLFFEGDMSLLSVALMEKFSVAHAEPFFSQVDKFLGGSDCSKEAKEKIKSVFVGFIQKQEAQSRVLSGMLKHPRVMQLFFKNFVHADSDTPNYLKKFDREKLQECFGEMFAVEALDLGFDLRDLRAAKKNVNFGENNDSLGKLIERREKELRGELLRRRILRAILWIVPNKLLRKWSLPYTKEGVAAIKRELFPEKIEKSEQVVGDRGDPEAGVSKGLQSKSISDQLLPVSGKEEKLPPKLQELVKQQHDGTLKESEWMQKETQSDEVPDDPFSKEEIENFGI